MALMPSSDHWLTARRRRTRLRVGAILAISLIGAAGSAQGATVSKPGLTATVIATVSPTRLPTTGSVPASVTIAGSIINRAEGASTKLRSIEVRLDQQLTIDTEGLPVCPLSPTFFQHAQPSPGYVREKCGHALIGSGTQEATIEFPDQPPFTLNSTFLFLNGRSGTIMMYRYEHGEEGDIPLGGLPFGTGRRLTFPSLVNSSIPGRWSFRFRFGRTWHYQGRTHSYLNGRCTRGAFQNRIVLTLSDGTVSSASPERCTKGA